jgi:hypothetical protein
LRSDYVGASDRDDAASLHATVRAAKRLVMTSRHPTAGHWLNLSPDELHSACSDLTPLLPPRVSLWGFNLVTQFHDVLSFELQELILSDASYSTPDLSTLLTRSSQLAALRSIRVGAVLHFIFIRAQEKLIAKTVLRKLKQSLMALAAPISVAAAPAPLSSVPSSQVADDVSDITHTFVSPAEQTMQRYQPESSSTYPTDPAANFTSSCPLGFAGCMFCGSSDHV